MWGDLSCPLKMVDILLYGVECGLRIHMHGRHSEPNIDGLVWKLKIGDFYGVQVEC